ARNRQPQRARRRSRRGRDRRPHRARRRARAAEEARSDRLGRRALSDLDFCRFSGLAGAMAEREKLGFGARLAIGGIAGFVATMAMTSAMRRLHRQLPARERYPLTPREIVDSTLDPPPAVAP